MKLTEAILSPFVKPIKLRYITKDTPLSEWPVITEAAIVKVSWRMLLWMRISKWPIIRTWYAAYCSIKCKEIVAFLKTQPLNQTSENK